MSKTRALLVVALMTAGLLAGIGTATAAPKGGYSQPTVQWVSPTVLASSHAGGGGAIVQARYQCWGGDVGTHLFIAVKQGELISPENTGSANATAFYSTNWGSDGPSLALHCDGASHNQSFRLVNDPYWWNTAAAPKLVSGSALIQFCLFDSTSSEGSDSGFALDYSMGTVKVLN